MLNWLFFVVSIFIIKPIFASNNINWWGIGGSYSNNPAMGWHIITFIVFVGSLMYFIYKPLSSYFKERSLSIKDTIFEVQKANKQAKTTMILLRDRLLNLDKEIEVLNIKATKIGYSEKKKLLDSANLTKSKIRSDAVSIISSELAFAKNEIKVFLVKKSLVCVLDIIKNRKIR